MADLVPVQDASAEFGVSLVTLYRHLRKGRLRRYKRSIGDPKTYVDRGELKRLLELRPVKTKTRKGRRT